MRGSYGGRGYYGRGYNYPVTYYYVNPYPTNIITTDSIDLNGLTNGFNPVNSSIPSAPITPESLNTTANTPVDNMGTPVNNNPAPTPVNATYSPAVYVIGAIVVIAVLAFIFN